MKYPQITFSEVYRDWEVELCPLLTICIDAEEFQRADEAVEQAMLWEIFSKFKPIKRGAK